MIKYVFRDIKYQKACNHHDDIGERNVFNFAAGLLYEAVSDNKNLI